MLEDLSSKLESLTYYFLKYALIKLFKKQEIEYESKIEVMSNIDNNKLW